MTPLRYPLWSLDDAWYGNAVDDDGVEWWVESEDGWSSSPAIRGDSGDLPGGDGGYDSNPLFGPRVISITGTAVGPTPEATNSARLAFPSLLERSRGGVLTFTEDGRSLSCAVRPSGPFRAQVTSAQSFQWQMQLTAPDPRKYGPATETTTTMAGSSGGLAFPVAFPADFGAATGGSVTCENGGTVKSWPVIRISGPCINPRVTNPATGDGLAINLTLAAGDYLDIDTAARTVLLQGTASRRSRVATSGEWCPIAPGGASLSFGADSYDPAALMTVSARSAWI